jgi:hypothetical protein
VPLSLRYAPGQHHCQGHYCFSRSEAGRIAALTPCRHSTVLALLVLLAVAPGGTDICLAKDSGDDQLATIITVIGTALQDVDSLSYNAAYNTANIDGSVTIHGATAFGGDNVRAEGSPSHETSEMSVDDAQFFNTISTTGIGAYNNGHTVNVVIDQTRELSDETLFTTFCGTARCAQPANNGLLPATASAVHKMPNAAAFNLAYNSGSVDASVTVAALKSVHSGTDNTDEYGTNTINSLKITTTAIGAYNSGSLNLTYTRQEVVNKGGTVPPAVP